MKRGMGQMELIDRYIYAVTRRLPEKQREDIAKELRGLIEDMLAQRAEETESGDAAIKAVLLELGEPSALAAKYSGKPRYLIGPELFGTYLMVLKIALAAAAFGMLVAMTVRFAVTPPQYVGEVFGNVIGSVFDAAVEAFAWVTAIFALIERYGMDIGGGKWTKREWDPGDLPEIPVKGAQIKRHEAIVGIVFTVVFFILLNFAPQLFSAYSSANGAPPVPIFNLDVLRAYLPLINICFALSIVKEILKLVFGRYNLKFAVSSIIISFISMTLAVIAFSNFNIWNLDFVPAMQKAYGATLPAGFAAAQPVIIFARVIIGIIVFSFGVETIVTVVRTLRYNMHGIKNFITGAGR
jgi:hypothetical protein